MKWIYKFDANLTEGSKEMKALLGGKGANLAEMSLIGLPVPPGFTITTEVCDFYYKNTKSLPTDLKNQVNDSIKVIEQLVNAEFGNEENPLLISVRSGARASMPGMMDSILNLGLNSKTVEGLAKKTNNKRFAYDSYRRFIQMYSSIVLNVDHYLFEELIDLKKQNLAIIHDFEFAAEDLIELVEEFKSLVKSKKNIDFPEDLNEQLWGAIVAVFDSWMNNRAITYRKLNSISDNLGTAVNIQAMVFGNMGEDSATGVAFTRDPSTGDNIIYGEYLIIAQGEDVVAGIRTPNQITLAAKRPNSISLEEKMPELYREFMNICRKLELHYQDMQDVEFTIQNNKLWILQTRSGKRSAQASLKIAVDLVNEGIITKNEAIMRIDPFALDQLLHPMLDPSANFEVLDRGLPASPGAASGIVVFSSEEAAEKALWQKVILVRMETSPEDIHGMHVAQGILTSRGGMTSHAAVVARGMGKPCVCGASNLIIDYKEQVIIKGNKVIKAGELITINGTTGEIIIGEVPKIEPHLSDEFKIILSWADNVRRLKVRANAETVEDSTTAYRFGAEGIGLCRTEHMFFASERIFTVREMILATSKEERAKALSQLLPMQVADFVSIFKIMKGLPVNIRLLDPPLHEFLPHNENEIAEIANYLGITIANLKNRIYILKEMNPMLGHRGCRLGITYPEIYEMQIQAIFLAMIEVGKASGNTEECAVEVMIPLVMTGRELELFREMARVIAEALEKEHGFKLNYQLGTMIELPRSALMAFEIAEFADFFSFGTNDLTQTTLGLSRDDAGSFLDHYISQSIFEEDPFVKLDEQGVGELIKIAIDRGRTRKPLLKMGVCGEHGGHPESIKFFDKIGLDYVSCSPYRIFAAKLAAAQAQLSNN